jgi:hypothetical protein
MEKVEKLAREFSSVLMEWLTFQEMKEVVRRNCSDEYREHSLCATHDFCDSNMAMDSAFTFAFGVEFKPSNDEHLSLSNQAWSLAKQKGFWLGIYEAINRAEYRGSDYGND